MCESDGADSSRHSGRESLSDQPDEPHPQPPQRRPVVTGRRAPRD